MHSYRLSAYNICEPIKDELKLVSDKFTHHDLRSKIL